MRRKGTLRRRTLDRKKTEQALKRIRKSLDGIEYDLPNSIVSVEVLRTESSNVFFFNGEPLFVETEDTVVPTLSHEETLSRLPSVIVDQGAVPFVSNGADIMAPGVRQVEGMFFSGQLVVVRDERFHKALAIGRALEGSDQMRGKAKGKAVKSIHYVGDDIWQAYS